MRKAKGTTKGMTGLRSRLRRESNPKGGTALFYTFKNKHFIKMGCDGLAWLLWTLPDEYRTTLNEMITLSAGNSLRRIGNVLYLNTSV